MDAKANLLISFILTLSACSPYKIILSNSVLPSFYFEQKIKRLEKEEASFQKNRDLIKTKVEYSYGVILENNDRIIEDDYLFEENCIEEIIEADAVIKGQTVSSSFKPAILKNGIKVMVPGHIEVGTKIVVRPSDCTYVEKAKT